MKKSLLYLGAWLMFTFGVVAQTSNKGMLYVTENTTFSTLSEFDNLVTGSFFNDGDAFIYNNFNNDGILDYSLETGLTRFVGQNTQILSGSKISYLYHVYFNNASSSVPFQLSGAFDVSGISDFYQGIVDNDNFGGSISFSETGSHANTSDESHVDGEVYKTGSTSFDFPIGDGGYYRFSGTSELELISSYKAKYFLENSNDLYPHDLKAGVITAIDNQEYWTIEKESATDNDVLITLSWRDVTTPAEFIAAAQQEALTIVRWDELTNMWVNEGGAIDMDNQTVTTAITGYGVFTFGLIDSGIVLPCGIIVYNGVTPNGDGLNDYFFIDKTNPDCANDLHVQIYNRWGVKVFESKDYGVNGNVFTGQSNGRLTVDGSNQLPTGTYFYILDYEYDNGHSSNRHKQAGYLYLGGN